MDSRYRLDDLAKGVVPPEARPLDQNGLSDPQEAARTAQQFVEDRRQAQQAERVNDPKLSGPQVSSALGMS